MTLFQTDYDHEFTDTEIVAKIKVISDALYKYVEGLTKTRKDEDNG